MRRSRQKWLIIIAALTALAISFTPLQPTEPKYNGKKLCAWLDDLSGDNTNSFAPAIKAIRSIGTNATPFLIAELRRSRERVPERRWQTALRQRIETLFHTGLDPGSRKFRALAGLEVLGPSAAAACPDLENILNTDPPDDSALLALASIGKPGRPALQRATTNSIAGIRYVAIACLQRMNTGSNFITNLVDFPSFRGRLSELHVIALHMAFEAATGTNSRPPVLANPIDSSPTISKP